VSWWDECLHLDVWHVPSTTFVPFLHHSQDKLFISPYFITSFFDFHYTGNNFLWHGVTFPLYQLWQSENVRMPNTNSQRRNWKLDTNKNFWTLHICDYISCHLFKSMAFWNMTAYGLVERYKCLGETRSLHLQGSSKKKVIKRPHAHPNSTNDTLTLKTEAVSSSTALVSI